MEKRVFVYQAVMAKFPDFQNPTEVITQNPVNRGDAVLVDGENCFVESVWHRKDRTLLYVQMSPLKYVIELE